VERLLAGGCVIYSHSAAPLWDTVRPEVRKKESVVEVRSTLTHRIRALILRSLVLQTRPRPARAVATAMRETGPLAMGAAILYEQKNPLCKSESSTRRRICRWRGGMLYIGQRGAYDHDLTKLLGRGINRHDEQAGCAVHVRSL
jgi:hypothetical protein